MGKPEKLRLRHKRKAHIRKRVFGTPGKPRLTIFRSLNHIYAQVIDDTVGQTIVSASTRCPDLREKVKSVKKKEAAKEVGLLVAKRCLDQGVQQVVFDRNGFLYHGRVAAVADGAREGGLKL